MQEPKQMDRRIDAHVARTQLGQIMDRAVEKNERFVVERRDEPAVVIILPPGPSGNIKARGRSRGRTYFLGGGDFRAPMIVTISPDFSEVRPVAFFPHLIDDLCVDALGV